MRSTFCIYLALVLGQLFIGYYIGAAVSHSVAQPKWDDTCDLDAIESALRSQAIIKLIPIQSYLAGQGIIEGVGLSNPVYLAILQSGLKAIFKPEKDLSSFSSLAEIAAYRASKWLGLRFVPPTVLKTYKNLRGSLQFFVESSKLRDKQAYKKLRVKDISDMCLFYFILGKWDSHLGNQIIVIRDNKAYLALIDNTSIKYRQQAQYGDDPFICVGHRVYPYKDEGPFPFKQAHVLLNPTLEKAKEAFGNFIHTRKVQHIKRILKRNPHRITYCVWRNNVWVERKLRHIVSYLRHFTHKPNYTHVYYQSTLQRYSELDRRVLESIWAEALQYDKAYFDELIDEILERRDQVLKAAAQKGAIIY